MFANDKKQNPDILLLAGDMTVKNGKRTDCVIEFLKEVGFDAPVYYAPGNHEIPCRSMSLLSGRFKS
ncbi:MAG: metallophosphoesterase family protein [Clostridium sp.]